MPLTIDEFRRGVEFWRTRRWDQDFHNRFYGQLAAANPHGQFDLGWWETFLPRLVRWRAIRPLSRASMTSHATAAFPALTTAWRQSVAPLAGKDISEFEWDDVAAFPETVTPIKPLRRPSPVFTSKFCHFLAPHVFPVVDNAAMGNRHAHYRDHYQSVRDAWLTTSPATQRVLRQEMTNAVGGPLAADYPVVNKAVELCLIGRRHSY
jgi:hypothetical protein